MNDGLGEDRSLGALLLALCWPGLGHAIRRRWLRSLGWLLAIVVVVTVVFYQAGIDQIDSVGTFYAAFRHELDPAFQVALLGLHGLQAIDAYALDPDVAERGRSP